MRMDSFSSHFSGGGGPASLKLMVLKENLLRKTVLEKMVMKKMK